LDLPPPCPRGPSPACRWIAGSVIAPPISLRFEPNSVKRPVTALASSFFPSAFSPATVLARLTKRGNSRNRCRDRRRKRLPQIAATSTHLSFLACSSEPVTSYSTRPHWSGLRV